MLRCNVVIFDNLQEEEEQLLSAPKEDNRASEATRRVVQEEEERLILQKGPLQRKLADISYNLLYLRHDFFFFLSCMFSHRCSKLKSLFSFVYDSVKMWCGKKEQRCGALFINGEKLREHILSL